MQRPAKKRENLSSLFCWRYIAVKVNQRSSTTKIFHECDILDIRYHLFWNPSLNTYFVLLITPFLFSTFPMFYYSVFYFGDTCIKNKDGCSAAGHHHRVNLLEIWVFGQWPHLSHLLLFLLKMLRQTTPSVFELSCMFLQLN